MKPSKQAMEARARRAAKRVGLVARKSRWRAGTPDNLGNFMLVDERESFIVAGSRFEFTADEVIEWCQRRGSP